MKRSRNLITIAAFAFVLLGVPAIASAQYDPYGRNGQYDPNGRNGQYDPYGRNGQYDPYGRNGGWGNRGYGNMSNIVRSLKERARAFERQVDRDLDRSRYDGTRREDQLNRMAGDFQNAVNRLNSGNGNQDQERVRRVLDIANSIDRQIGRAGLSYASQNIWQQIRGDLQQLGYYGYGNRRNNNGGWNNGQRPSWWPF